MGSGGVFPEMRGDGFWRGFSGDETTMGSG